MQLANQFAQDTQGRRYADVLKQELFQSILTCLATISLPGQRQQEFLPGGCLFGRF